jgi:hypothetical protein
MPKSKIRKRQVYTAPTNTSSLEPVKIGSPAWLAPLMVTMFIVGLLWIVVFYVTQGDTPVHRPFDALWNVLIGFGFIGIGFTIATRWR